mgnify:CR=1 FL=1
MKLHSKKCCIWKTIVRYLSLIIDAEGVNTDPEKLGAIKNWLIPNCIKELQSFLGLCNYYRRLIKNYAILLEPLTSMTKTDSKFQWNAEKINSFNKLEDVLSSPPV